MLELALKFAVIGLILGMGVIEWGLDNRWHDQQRTRQRRARTVIGVIRRFVRTITVRRRPHSARPSGVLALGASRHLVGRR